MNHSLKPTPSGHSSRICRPGFHVWLNTLSRRWHPAKSPAHGRRSGRTLGIVTVEANKQEIKLYSESGPPALALRAVGATASFVVAGELCFAISRHGGRSIKRGERLGPVWHDPAMLLFTRCGAAHRFRQAIGCRASHTDGHEPATRCVKASAKKSARPRLEVLARHLIGLRRAWCQLHWQWRARLRVSSSHIK
jgi:hypothetical protein